MKIRKMFLTLGVILILTIVMAVSVFAAEDDFILSNTDSINFDGANIEYHGVDDTICYMLNANYGVGFQPVSFKEFVNKCGCDSYGSWIAYCNQNASDTQSVLLFVWLQPEIYSTSEEYFNKLYYYEEITQADLDELQATIDSKSDEITELENANLKLEENLAYTRNQVTTLSQSRGELLAVNASLEKQLQNKINLAYAQGLVDSGSTSDVVPVLIGVITLLEGVALVILIVSKIKNRKKGR